MAVSSVEFESTVWGKILKKQLMIIVCDEAGLLLGLYKGFEQGNTWDLIEKKFKNKWDEIKEIEPLYLSSNISLLKVTEQDIAETPEGMPSWQQFEQNEQLQEQTKKTIKELEKIGGIIVKEVTLNVEGSMVKSYVITIFDDFSMRKRLVENTMSFRILEKIILAYHFKETMESSYFQDEFTKYINNNITQKFSVQEKARLFTDEYA